MNPPPSGPPPIPPPAFPPGQPGPPPPPLRVAALGDLHAHKAHPGQHRELFAEISAHADVLALCGDLTNTGALEEAELLAADLAALRIPAVGVLGNHDHHSGHPDEVKRIIASKANVVFLDDDDTFELNGVGFAGVKGFGGGFGAHMLDSYGEDETKHFVAAVVAEALALEHALKKLSTPRTVVVLHYAPIADTVRGEPPEIAPFLGCSRLAETIDRFDSVTAVFHGHAHHGVPEGRTPRGIPVYNCAVEVVRRDGVSGGRGFVLVGV